MFTDHHFSQPVATCHRTDSFLLVWSHWGDCWCPEPRGSFSNGSLSRQTINTNDSSSPSPSFFPPFPVTDTRFFTHLSSPHRWPISLCLHLSFTRCLHTVPTSPPLCLAPESWHTLRCRRVTRATHTSDATAEHVYHHKA